MAVVQVTSREFRDNQKTWFDRADRGANIVISRGKKPSYILTRVDEDSFELSASMLERIEQGRRSIKEGKGVAMMPTETLDEFLDRAGKCTDLGHYGDK